MIELTVKLSAPASAGGGEGDTIKTVVRAIKLERAVATPQQLEKLLTAFNTLMIPNGLDELLDELHDDFIAQAKHVVKAAKKIDKSEPAAKGATK